MEKREKDRKSDAGCYIISQTRTNNQIETMWYFAGVTRFDLWAFIMFSGQTEKGVVIGWSSVLQVVMWRAPTCSLTSKTFWLNKSIKFSRKLSLSAFFSIRELKKGLKNASSCVTVAKHGSDTKQAVVQKEVKIKAATEKRKLCCLWADPSPSLAVLKLLSSNSAGTLWHLWGD